MKLTNEWVGYLDRTKEQIKNNVLTRLGTNVPEITDHSDSNPWVKAISIWASITEMLGFYIDNRAREAFLPTCRKFSSGVKHAVKFDYRIKGAVAASVDVKFVLSVAVSEAVTIPAGTRISTNAGIVFSTLEDAFITIGQTQIITAARQWEKVEGALLATSDGSADQKYDLEENVVDTSIEITVGAESYLHQETFAYSFSNDAHFVAGLNESAIMEVRFGDGISGKKPPAGQTIIADYYLSQGAAGNVAADTITTIVDSITVPEGQTISVNNELAAAGGADQETLADIKKNIPIHLRSFYGIVNEQHFRDIPSLAPGVAKSSYVYDGGRFVDIFIVPQGGGTASSDLLESVQEFVDARAMITTTLRVFPAGEINIKIGYDVTLLRGYLRSTTALQIQNNLIDYLSTENQEIGGEVRLGNLYQIIENTTGVNYSNIRYLTAIPYARILDGTSNLSWNPEPLLETSQINRWVIRMISATSFELIKDNAFQGNYNTGVTVEQAGIIRFTVTANNYQEGDRWEFYTYPAQGAIELTEASVPVLKSENIDARVYGGINS